MTFKRWIAAFSLMAFASACSTTSPDLLVESQNLGEAKARTMAAQVIDLAPEYEYLDPPTSGEHAAQAIDRYRKGAVKQPERVSSTSSSGPR